MPSIKKCSEFGAPRIYFFILSQKTKTERIYPLTTEDMTAAFEKITEVSVTDLLLPIKRFIITSRWPHWCSKAIFKITEPFLARWLVESHVIDKSKDHGNDVMVAQFVFLFLSRVIFRETSTKWTSNMWIEIFSVLNSAWAWASVILAGKGDSRRHSTTGFSENVVVTGTSLVIKWKKFYQLAIGRELNLLQHK